MANTIKHETLVEGLYMYIDRVDSEEDSSKYYGWIGSSKNQIEDIVIGGESVLLDKNNRESILLNEHNREDVSLFYRDNFNINLIGNNLGIVLNVPKKSTKLDAYVKFKGVDELVNIGNLQKWNAFYSGFENRDKGLIVVDNFYKDPDFIREWAMNNLEFSPSNYHKGERATSRFSINGTKEELESIIGKPIYNWNHDRYANGIFQFCTADQPIVYHVDNQTYAGMVFLTPEAPASTGTSFYRSKFTGDYKFDEEKRSTENYVKAFKGRSAEMNFYDGTNFEKIDEVGNVYNRLVLFDAKNIHAATQYFGDAIDNARFFHMFFFDV